MGLFDFFKRKASTLLNNKDETKPHHVDLDNTNDVDNLSYTDKERIMVERVTLEDMKQYAALPYDWNSTIQKSMRSGGHPFAYMNLKGENINVAKNELRKMNQSLIDAHRIVPGIPSKALIPVDSIVFSSTTRGYTRLICTPHTFTKKPSKYPAHLIFMTDLEQTSNSTHGELFYGKSGNIEKANVYCWVNGDGYFFFFKMIDKKLSLSKIESTKIMDSRGRAATIYQL